MPDAGGRLALHLDGHRIAQHFRRQCRNRRRHRRTEKERLTPRRQIRQDAADLGKEAHVEHAIGLVENEILEMAHPRITRPHVIQQPSWRGDDHVDAALERVFLRAHAHAAEDRRARDRGVDRQRVEIFENLRRELAGRRKDERAGRTPRLVDQPVQDRQQERRRLATAGLRRGNHVLALQRRRNCFSLNRGGPDETEFLDALEKRRMKPEMVEWHGSLCHGGSGLMAQGSGKTFDHLLQNLALSPESL